MKDRIKRYMKKEDVFPYRLRAAYTVEAAAVMAICMIFIGLLFMGGIHLYSSSMETVTSYERSEMEPQDLFRLTRAADSLFTGKDATVQEAD